MEDVRCDVANLGELGLAVHWVYIRQDVLRVILRNVPKSCDVGQCIEQSVLLRHSASNESIIRIPSLYSEWQLELLTSEI